MQGLCLIATGYGCSRLGEAEETSANGGETNDIGGVPAHLIPFLQEFVVSQIVIIAFSHSLWRSPSPSPHSVAPFILYPLYPSRSTPQPHHLCIASPIHHFHLHRPESSGRIYTVQMYCTHDVFVKLAGSCLPGGIAKDSQNENSRAATIGGNEDGATEVQVSRVEWNGKAASGGGKGGEGSDIRRK
ncbi:hypothetical protein Hypma_003111 [Hypsizygus marmoreus]|uniref:Uncharacterized protein n=1 Tax=Hypsizygus marmoreus TaxID=39966 RepID=A0A369J2H3_HYPMA|nr:hypothetical protein Hypma_003111 [Hypsizygus marmoreus]